MEEINVRIFNKSDGKLTWKGKVLYNPATHVVMPGENGGQEIEALKLYGDYVVETKFNSVEKRNDFSVKTKISPAEIVAELCDIIPVIIEQEENPVPPPAK
jgi:hypothetical protein